MTQFHLTLRNAGLVTGLFIGGLLFLVLPSWTPREVPFLLLFIGRLHPLILHFPIVLIILALVIEVLNRFYRINTGENTLKVILLAAAFSAALSVAAGFFLYTSGDYAGELMDRHLWAGALTGTAIFITAGLYYLQRQAHRYYRLYLGALLMSNASVAYASHLGGSITHGKGYLTEHLEFIWHSLGDEGENPDSSTLVLDHMLLPVFEARCLSCHNAQRAKGNFVMTSLEQMEKGGESGDQAIVAGDPEASELYARVVLPEGHSDRMPPEGKTPLSDAEVALLRYWISAGASDTVTIRTAREVDTLRRVVDALLPEVARYRRNALIGKVKLAALEKELQAAAAELDVAVARDTLSDDNRFSLALKFPPPAFTNEHLVKLRPWFDAFSKVSLTSSGVDDAGLYYLSQMSNLRELYLQRTGLSGSGIVHLHQLEQLEILNLSFTQVDDKSALDLLKIPNLKTVYLYRTQTSMQVIEALRRYRPEVRFLLEEGPYF